MEDYRDTAQWDTPAQLKNRVLSECGRGEDLLLTHLAYQIGKKRPLAEISAVKETAQYKSLFEIIADEVEQPEAQKSYKGRLESVDDLFSQNTSSTRIMNNE